MKTPQILISFFILILFLNFQCEEDNLCEPEQNIIALTVDLFPQKLEYNRGDTIWLMTEFETLVDLLFKDETILVENGKGNLGLFIMKLKGLVDINEGYYDFDIINEIGELNQELINDNISKQTGGYINFNCSPDICSFKFGIVPKKTGYYCIAMNLGEIEVVDTSACPARNRIRHSIFNVTPQNRVIYDELNMNYFGVRLAGTYSPRNWEIDNDGAFAFKVK